MQAIVLAAGMGKRLHKEINKCMVEVNGVSLWCRAMNALKKANIKKVVVVTGYNSEKLENYIMQVSSDMEIHFVRNYDYENTNNIWSLYLARDYFDEDTILLESDLIFEEDTIKKLCDIENENIAIVDKFASWMDGTTVCLEDGRVKNMIPKKEMKLYDPSILYKTVNIYKFSAGFMSKQYCSCLQKYILTKGKNEYYEMVLKDMVENEEFLLNGHIIARKWYEIDTIEDLKEAEKIFQRESK